MNTQTRNIPAADFDLNIDLGDLDLDTGIFDDADVAYFQDKLCKALESGSGAEIERCMLQIDTLNELMIQPDEQDFEIDANTVLQIVDAMFAGVASLDDPMFYGDDADQEGDCQCCDCGACDTDSESAAIAADHDRLMTMRNDSFNDVELINDIMAKTDCMDMVLDHMECPDCMAKLELACKQYTQGGVEYYLNCLQHAV